MGVLKTVLESVFNNMLAIIILSVCFNGPLYISALYFEISAVVYYCTIS